ncbi:uncharacterized protein CTRU02_212489 [Colletotrichum truncatum]|uniref:Uncharacterized protein n=2 Tax=Colletotrichum truncatum TaxID=5467 RepID=A0ACC3YEJ5_COLTU|nr:uncharacterized protein CTRU02_13537 [Colletotrichum truncatum]XP_036584627.1 uncharacterized protein CTRU02_05702 [Colletotrichum truncatum]KAF6783301.1 hypothetical protein CTRU02_13537 [Colletotrichum truncatum]KAF6794145.1 hypothetical protein CTRU02_05702 [Colletotrichum truncatum]
MASPASFSRDSFAEGTGPKLDSSTPPENNAFLLTPPASCGQKATSEFDVDKWIRTLEGYLDPSTCCPSTTRIRVPSTHYRQAMKVLEQRPSLSRLIEDKVRWDYDPASGLITLRMPAPVHDIFSTSVANEIYKQLQDIAARPDKDGAFAGQIINGGSSRILLQETGEEPNSIPLQRHPDAQFQHRKAAFPGVVLEVSYSQDGKNLKRLAWDYIQHSNGDIKAVIGLDVNHGVKPSTVSLWRPEYTRDDGEDFDTLGVQAEIEYQAFRSPNLDHVNGTDNIQLALSDFATDALSDVSTTPINIKLDRLAELLDEAEEVHKAREEGLGGGIRSKRTIKKRPRSSSPAEQILSEDELVFRIQEDKVLERADAKDHDFHPPVKRRSSTK